MNPLGQDLVDDFTVDIGQPVITSLESIRQFCVIKTEQVHDCRLQVVDVDFVFGDREAQFIRFPVREPAFDATTGQPH